MGSAERRRPWTAARACVLVAALGAACSGSAGPDGGAPEDAATGAVRVEAGEAVQIRSISSLTSPTGNASRNYLDAARLAVADYGPIHGRFAVALGDGLDDRCSPDGGGQAARAVLSDPRVVGVIGTACSAAAAVASPLLSGAGLVMVSPSNTAPSLTSDLAGNPGDNHHPGYFRTAPNDLHQGETVAVFVHRELGLSRAAAVHDGDAYTLGLATAFASAFEDLGGTVTSLARLDRDAPDLAADLAALADGGPQAVFVALFTNLARLVIEQRHGVAGLRDAAFIGPSDFLGDDFLGEQASAGIYMAGPDTRHGRNVNESTGRSADDVLGRFVAATGAPPQQALWAHAYDAATLLLEAVEASSRLDGDALVIDRAALRQHLRGVSGYRGLVGEISCDAFGDCGPAGQVVYHHEDPSDPGAAASNIVFTRLPAPPAPAVEPDLAPTAAAQPSAAPEEADPAREPGEHDRDGLVLAPLRTDDLQAALLGLSPEERSCLGDLGDKAMVLQELVLVAGPSPDSPSPAAMATVIGCLHDETVLRLFVTQLIGQTEPFSEETSACIRAGLTSVDPRRLLAPAGAVDGPADSLASGMAALSVSVACMDDGEWDAYASRLGMSAGDREQAACLLRESGGPEELVESMRAASLGRAPEGFVRAGRACGLEPLQPATEPGEAPVPDAASFAPQPHIMLRVVLVPDGQDEWPFDSAGGWTQAVTQRASEALRYYEAAIWEETGSVHLYSFPNDYDPLFGIFGDIPAAETTAYREQHAIRVHGGMPEASSPERSEFLRGAFEDFASLLAELHPDAEHHLMFSGHGGPGGHLFEGQLERGDAGAFLAAWTQRLGRPLGVIDMGGPCNKGGYDDLANFCEHARYYVASDLANGGYSMDEWTAQKYYETDAETQYHRLLASAATLEEALAARVDLRRQQYEYSRNNQTRDRVPQASYVYSCAAFNDFSAAFEAFLDETAVPSPAYDLYQLMLEQSAAPGLLEKFRGVLAHTADNRDFFAWDITANGIISPLERT